MEKTMSSSMKRVVLFFLFAIGLNIGINAQQQHFTTCDNKLGAWIWYLKLTKFKSYESLADTLASLGIKRIYIKLADGQIDSAKWPELKDPNVPQIFADRGIEAWGWSYNYPGNEYQQAKTLYHAAKAGYKGFVVDIEVQFNRKPAAASKLFYAFDKARDKAKAENLIGDDFKLYCTTWGNPRTHGFPIATINQYVDGFMSQTYVENWGNEHLFDIEGTIDAATKEYKSLGATKPVHHIVSTEKGIMSTDEINRFLSYAGGESSVWPVPGVNTSLLLWHTWNKIDWDYDFCHTNRDEYVANMEPKVKVYGKKNEIIVEEPVSSIQILNNAGHIVAEIINPSTNIDISSLLRGRYVMNVITNSGNTFLKHLVKR
jgi:hypothetical protein